MQQDWKRFLEQRAFVVRDTTMRRAHSRLLRSGMPAVARCVDLNHFAALQLVGPDASDVSAGLSDVRHDAARDRRARCAAPTATSRGASSPMQPSLLDNGHPSLVVHASLRDVVVESLRKYLAFSRSRFAAVDATPILLGLIEPNDAALPAEPLTVAPFRGGYAVCNARLTPARTAGSFARPTRRHVARIRSARRDRRRRRVGSSRRARRYRARYASRRRNRFCRRCSTTISSMQSASPRAAIWARKSSRVRNTSGSRSAICVAARGTAAGCRQQATAGRCRRSSAATLVNVAPPVAQWSRHGDALAVLNDGVDGSLHVGTMNFALQ